MKNPKKLTRSQKEKLTKKHIDANEYVVVYEDCIIFTVQKKDKVGTEEGKIVFSK